MSQKHVGTPGFDLSWLNSALFAAGGFEPAARSGAAGKRWAPLPNAESPRRLVPTEPRAARGAMGNRHDAMSQARRIAGSLSQRIVATGVPGRIVRQPIALSPELCVGGDSAASVLAMIAEVLNQARVGDAVDVAVTLGPRRYNRKPVVQFLDGAGQTIAFAKIACDAVTSNFVAHETTWIEKMATSSAAGGTSTLRVPAALASPMWAGRPVLVLAAVSPAGHDPIHADAARLASVARAVAETGPIIDTRLGDAAHIDEIELAAAAANDIELTEAAHAVRQTFGDRDLRVGPWHGDFSPWNMMSTAQVTWLIDWEFASEAIPLGLDLVHNRVMVETHLNDMAIADALVLARRELASLLTAVDDGSDVEAAFAVYLLELRRRDADLAIHGAAPTGFGPAALGALNRLIEGR